MSKYTGKKLYVRVKHRKQNLFFQEYADHSRYIKLYAASKENIGIGPGYNRLVFPYICIWLNK